MFTWPQVNAFRELSQEARGVRLAIRHGNSAGRSVSRSVSWTSSSLPRSVAVAALGMSLVLSALLTAAALRLPGCQWLAWISFLPLFVLVRSLGRPIPPKPIRRNRPALKRHRSGNRALNVCHCPVSSVSPMPRGRPFIAALAGGFWGGWLYLFCSTGPPPAVDPVGLVINSSAWLFALLILIPAVYVWLATLPARAIGFKLLILALGWTLIEVVLHLHHQLGTREGLLIGSQGEGLHLHWLARLLGYVFTAFLVACANASLIGILSGARLSFPVYWSFAGSPNAMAWHPSQVALTIQSWTLRQAHPRAPPN